jgi:hypothetical protein
MKVQDLYAFAVMEMQSTVDGLEHQLRRTLEKETRAELNSALGSAKYRLNRFLSKNADLVAQVVESEMAEFEDHYGNEVILVNKQYADPHPPFVGEPRPFTSLRLDCCGEKYLIQAEMGGLSVQSLTAEKIRIGMGGEPQDSVFLTTLDDVEEGAGG